MHIFFIPFTIHLIVNAFFRFCPFFFWKVNLIVIIFLRNEHPKRLKDL